MEDRIENVYVMNNSGLNINTNRNTMNRRVGDKE